VSLLHAASAIAAAPASARIGRDDRSDIARGPRPARASVAWASRMAVTLTHVTPLDK
jgi:hypothetical protein